jgi:hypothetical protein
MTLGKYRSPVKQKKKYLLTWEGEGKVENTEYTNLLKARIQARKFFRAGLFINLINVNGIPLPL